jgi:hypothetical protein
MTIIEVRELIKEFRTPRRQPGRLGGLRTLFTTELTVTRAVDGDRLDNDIRPAKGLGLGTIGAPPASTACSSRATRPTSPT